MHKFFTSPELVNAERALILGDDVKHLYKVLRLQEGDEIVINNERGKEYLGRIKSITKTEVVVEIVKELHINNESPLEIYLFQGLPKAAKMDLIVQKGTELGIKEFIPVITGRVDIKLKGEFKKLDRLQRIALEACKQCKRTLIPMVKEPVEFDAMLKLLEEMDLVVVPYENAENYGIKALKKDIEGKSITKIAIIVGPEGGFEEQEISKLKDSDAYIVTLGPRIFRTETAGFVVTALLQYELGDLGGKI